MQNFEIQFKPILTLCQQLYGPVIIVNKLSYVSQGKSLNRYLHIKHLLSLQLYNYIENLLTEYFFKIQ